MPKAPTKQLTRNASMASGASMAVMQEDNDNAVQEMIQSFQDWVEKKIYRKKPTVHSMKKAETVILQYRVPVEVDEEASALAWVDHVGFDIAVCFVIVLNCVIIGLEVDLGTRSGPRPAVWIVIEAFFVVFFMGEVTLKVLFHGRRWMWENVGNAMTVIFAVCTVFNLVILTPLQQAGVLRAITLIRVVGLFRLYRVISKNPNVEELRLVINSIKDSVSVLMWAALIVLVLVYIGAVILTKQIGQNEELYFSYRKLSGGWDYTEAFGTIPRSMFTLVQIMTLDMWSSGVVRHVLENQWFMALFFILFQMLTAFGIMNIIVSAVVERTLTSSRMNRARTRVRMERRKRHDLNQLKAIFMMADQDGSGQLDLEEFAQAVKMPEVKWRMKVLDLPIDDAMRLFGVIDGDGSRSLSISEFIEGCTKLKGPAQSRDMIKVKAQADQLLKKIDCMEDHLLTMERMLVHLDEATKKVQRRVDSGVAGSRIKIARAFGGAKPLVPLSKVRDEEASLAMGNQPVLPNFPGLLN